MTAGRQVFKDHKMEVWAVTEQLDDHTTREKTHVVHPGAAVILAITQANQIVLIRNRRDAINQSLLELPAGTLEPPEPPITCAARELREETGYEAAVISPLTTFYTTPGFCTEEMHAFTARDLTFVGQDLAAGEDIEVTLVPLPEVKAMMRSGTLRDGKTLATLGVYFMQSDNAL